MRYNERILYNWQYGYHTGSGSGTILAGVTRDSAIVLLKEMGLKVEERSLSIDEIIDAHKAGTLTGGIWYRNSGYYFIDQRAEV